MATPPIPVIGLSPVTFASEDTNPGKQYQIPLAALTFDTKGAIDASNWPPIKNNDLKTNDKKLVPLVLADLLKRGILSKPPPSP